VVANCSPVISAEKIPSPVPEVILLLSTVGLAVVAQQIPLSVIEALPSDVILPPAVAEPEVMFAGATVATVGNTGSFLHPNKIITADRYSEISRTFEILNFLFINF
jgi:hypothetical protein